MQTMNSSTAKMNAGLAVSVFGWIVMAFAMRNLGTQLALLDLGTLLAGFGLLIGGLCMMIWAER